MLCWFGASGRSQQPYRHLASAEVPAVIVAGQRTVCVQRPFCWTAESLGMTGPGAVPCGEMLLRSFALEV